MRQVLDPEKRTTKVNLGVIIAVITFFVLMGWLVVHYLNNPDKPKEEMNQRMDPGTGTPERR